MSRTYLSHFCKERKRTVSHSKKRGKRIGALLFRYMEIIGELYRMDGELIHRYKAKQAGIVLYYTTALGVRAGDSLAAIGKLESHLPLKDREGTP